MAKQRSGGTYFDGRLNTNATAADYLAVKITGDSLVSNNNPLMAENEIGIGRDVSSAVPGGFAAAGAINGNLRARSAAVMLDAVTGVGSRTAAANYDNYAPQTDLNYFTIEKKVGAASPELLVLRYSDCWVNTLNITAPAGALATFSAGIVASGETRQTINLATPTYAAASDDLLVFHGGRLKNGDTGQTLTQDETFQSMEVVWNNNAAADEWTVRPSRFLRTLTEGMRQIDVNMTLVFENPTKYSQYAYGAAAATVPGYNLYMGALEFFLGNWQIVPGEDITTVSPSGAPSLPQAVQFSLYKVAFTGLPVALATGRIVVTTTARVLKDPTLSTIAQVQVRPTGSGFTY